jgi:two-component system C4-dicarboxylate transport sensor histidine kinase DctB
VTLYRGGEARAPMLRALLGVAEGEVAAILLPVKARSVLLLCAARRGFAPENLDFARRFALLLEQALLLKDEQERVLQAAKLSALGRMAASLAHELCQPLGTIGVAAQNLEMLSEAGPVAQDILRRKIARILGQVERAGRIMDRMRRFARKSGGVQAKADIAALADGVRLLLEHLLTPAGIALELDIAAGLSLYCDATAIEQVLVNLVRNAMDALSGIGSAAPHAAVQGRIVIRGRALPHGIILSVEDNGPGFPPGIESQPPENFFTTKNADQGTGLGLSICHMIARAHGGTLKLGNHAGGAFARLELPERAP